MPKTFNNLFESVCATHNLLHAAHKAALGKREKPYVDRFRMNLEHDIWSIREELLSGRYKPGPYRSFWITDPKKRLISAAPFRDRVVHHALCNIIEPLWERRFVSESFANRKGKGTSVARDHFAEGMARFPYVLKLDIHKFFPSMDHDVLKRQFRRVIRCRRTLELMDLLVDSSNPQEPIRCYFPGDDLWTPYRRRHGLPLGNQTSQFFANVYMDPLDHFIKEELRCSHYTRYVDDFALFGTDKATLRTWMEEIRAYAAGLRLRLHKGKSRIYTSHEGATFLGVRFWPKRRRLVSDNVRRMRRRLKRGVLDLVIGRIDYTDLERRWAGWLGHAQQAGTRGLLANLRRDAARWRTVGERALPRSARRRMEQSRNEYAMCQPKQESTLEQEHE